MESTITPWGPLGYLTFKTAYARPLDDSDPLGDSEEWPDTCARVLRGTQAAGAGFTPDEADRFLYYMLMLKATPAGRGIWTLGSPLQDALGSDAAVNCWFTSLACPADYAWLVSRLMAGGGVGYSVEMKYAYRWPIVQGGEIIHTLSVGPEVWMVPDSREGWATTVSEALRTLVNGGVFKFNTSLVRPFGAPLKTFGGTASGPEPLIAGLFDMARVMGKAVGRKPHPIELSDVANICAALVVAGNKRRAAQLAQGSGYDELYLTSKRWADNPASWRSQANFSVNVSEFEDLGEEFWMPYDKPGIGENFGIVNTAAYWQGRTGEPLWRPDSVRGVNPCAEIGLPDKGSCNLATLHLPNLLSYDEARDAARLLYRMQKAVSQLPHPDPYTQQVMNRDARLGLSITGYLQATEEQRQWLPDIYEYLQSYDIAYSREHNLPRSIRLTTVKPEGTVSMLSGCTSGGHAAYAEQYVRRMRFHPQDKLVPAMLSANVPILPDRNLDGSIRHDQVVAEFPVSVPVGTTLAHEQSAVDQLEVLARLQREWADNAVSVTVTYRDEEIPSVRTWLSDHWSEIKGVSFLRYEDHGFHLPPFEPIDRDEYHKRQSALKPLKLNGPAELIDDLTACAGGSCPIR